MICLLCAQRAFAVLVLLAVVGAVVVGCAWVEIESRVDSTEARPFQRVLVLSHLARISDNFGAWSEESLAARCTSAGLTVRVVTLDPLALDSDELGDVPADFRPEVVLVLRPTEVAGVNVGRASQARIDASLYAHDSDVRFWRATMKVISGGADLPLQREAADSMVRKMIDRMQRDGLLPPAT